MSKNMPLSAGVSHNRESTKVDKIGTYLDQLFDPQQEPNGIFLYDWENSHTGESGAALFSHVAHSPAYKAFTDKEVELFILNKHAIIAAFTHKNVNNIVDMGPGNGHKSAKVLGETLGEKLQGKTYIPVDISPYFTQHASHEVQHHLHSTYHSTRIKSAGLAINFLESNAALKDLKDKMYFFLGGSIGNFSDEQIVQILKNMASDGGKKNNIIFSYFTAPDKNAEDYEQQIQKMSATYGDPDHHNPYYDQKTHDAIKAWIMGGFDSLGIDTSKLEFFVRYDEAHTKMVLGAKIKEDITVKHHGKLYAKEAGDELLAIQSKRFTRSKIYNLADLAKTKVKQIDDHAGIGMSIMESDRTPEAKERRENKKKWGIRGAIATTLLAGAIKGGMVYEKTKQDKNMKENLENVLHNKLEPKQYNSGYYTNLNDEAKRNLFTKKAHEFFEVLYERYDLSDFSEAKQEFIKTLLFQWLINQNESTINITTISAGQGIAGYPNHTYEKTSELIEVFIDENSYTLTANDVTLHLHSKLASQEKALKNTLESKENFSIRQRSTSAQARSVNSTRQNYDWIGPYTTSNGESYLVGKCKKGDKEYIVACSFYIPGETHEEKQKRVKSYKDGTLSNNYNNINLTTNNTNIYEDLTIENGKIIAEDYYKKPYFNKLAEKVVATLKKDPQASQYDIAIIISHMTYSSKEGYDFSWLINTKNNKDISVFAHTYLSQFFTATSSEFDKSTAIHNIFDVAVNKYMTSIKDNVYNDAKGKGKLESAIFHRLCSKELRIQSSISIQKWINENEDIFTPRIPKNTYPRINPEKASILDKVTLYKKQDAEDIKHDPGLVNMNIYLYEDLEGNQYEIGLYKGDLYARYIIPDLEKFYLGTTPTYIKHLRDNIIAGCKKEGLGVFSPEVMERKKTFHKTSSEGFIAQGDEMYIKSITDKLFAHNTEIGNIVLQDYWKRKKYSVGDGIAPH